MARIGTLALGSWTDGCGVAFELSAPAPLSTCMELDDSGWVIEVLGGEKTVVGRTATRSDRDEVLTMGLEQVERCLDVIAFQHHKSLVLREPGDRHIIVFDRADALVAQHVSASDLAFTVRMTMVAEDESGAIIPPPPPRTPVWIPGLRFYRLSQSNANLHDAYRSLWLGLEALLGSVAPVEKGERQADWLFRALNSAAAAIDLRPFAPAGKDPVSYIIGTQYDHVRCRLFHAKPQPGEAAVDQPSPEEVLTAYEALIRLWRFIATEACKVPAGGSGGTTYEGFRYMMDEALGGRMSMFFTPDSSPATKDDVDVSPRGLEVWGFDNVQYLGETAPGRVTFVGTSAVNDLHRRERIGRVCSKVADTLLTAMEIEGGLDVNGVDVFESRQTIRLVNPDLPRTAFGARD